MQKSLPITRTDRVIVHRVLGWALVILIAKRDIN